MITKLRKGILHREVITSQGVGPYSGNLKVIYWLGCDRKGIMDTQWHDRTIEHTWKKSLWQACRAGKEIYGGRLAGREWEAFERSACRHQKGENK